MPYPSMGKGYPGDSVEHEAARAPLAGAVGGEIVVADKEFYQDDAGKETADMA